MKGPGGRLRRRALAVLGVVALLAACSQGELDPIPHGIVEERPLPGNGSSGAPDAGAMPACGDGEVEGTEACDDGNTAAGDGCSASCALESAFEGDTCPGRALALQRTGALLRASVTGSTVGAYNHYASGCGGGSGGDVVYTFTPESSGKARITLTADFAGIVSARSDCPMSASEVQCVDIAVAAGGTRAIEVPVFASTPAFVLVDGYGGARGAFTLDVEISLAACGNGTAELPEACDDGNTVNGDGCSSTCALEAGGSIAQCPGQPFELSGAPGVPRRISFTGSTLASGQPSQGSAGCFYWAGNNTVYAVKSDVSGAVKAELLSGYAKANLHARSDCGSNAYQLGCTQIEAPGVATLELPVSAGQWFYLFVDGHKSGGNDYGGPYTLDVTVTPSACGNGALDGDEQCDDGNAVEGDGCAPSCALEALAGTDACPGHAVPLAPRGDGSRTGVVSGTTIGNPDTFPACASGPGTSGDAVFAVTPDIDGLLEARVRGPFNAIVSVLSSCAPPVGAGASVVACSWKGSVTTEPFGLDGLGSTPKVVTAPVVAGTTYFVVVDSAVSSGAASGGPFTLELRVTPAVCGNGVVEGGEGCDDGATDPEDGCSATCALEPITSRSTCGDAEVVAMTEDAPGAWSASLRRGTTNLLANGDLATSKAHPCHAPGRNALFSLTAPAAGVLRARVESTAFDAVLGIRRPSCALTGTPFACANAGPKGVAETLATPVAAGETLWLAVDGRTVDELGRFTLDLSITPSGCGDGFFVPGPSEACDDGNAASGDGCSATCALEPQPGVDVCPGTTLTLAGASGGPRRGTITFATTGLHADYAGACGGSAKDGVVRVVAPIGGTLQAVARNLPGATVYARRVCLDPASEIAKSNTSTCLNVTHDTVAFPVSMGDVVFLFVDGLEGAVGVPTLEVTVTP